LGNSGAKGARTRIIVVGRVRIDHLFLASAVTSVPYPFLPQLAKVHLRSAAISAVKRARNTTMPKNPASVLRNPKNP
jgi:hypothetical protein